VSASRAIAVKLHEGARTATLLAADDQPEGLSAASQGNAQSTADGSLFVGWASLPYFSQFERTEQLIYNARFPARVNSYRAYLLPWREGPGRGPWPAA